VGKDESAPADRRPGPPHQAVRAPSVARHDVELVRRQLPAQTSFPAADVTAVIELRSLAVRYGPPRFAIWPSPSRYLVIRAARDRSTVRATDADMPRVEDLEP
jgi:hypothetical protein